MVQLFEKKLSMEKSTSKIEPKELESIEKNQGQAGRPRQVYELCKESLVKMCSESTSHGLPNMFRTENWAIRIFWLVLFLCGSGVALYCNKRILKNSHL
jgi:hypothetical protein